MMRKLTAFVSGRVQKTGYRARVVMIANAFGLKGYIQNLPDGRVKIVAEGDDSDLDRFLKAVDIKNTMIEVMEIQKDYSPATGEFQGFEKMVSGGETDQRLDKAAELLKELIGVTKGMAKEQRATTEEIRATKEEVRATREELRDEIRATREEVRATHEDLVMEIKSTRDEIIEPLNEIRDSQKEMAGETKELRSDLKDRLEDRLQRIEYDVSQIKTKVGL